MIRNKNNKGEYIMQLLFIIIKRTELLDDIMKSLAAAGIHGGTSLDSMGMAKSISNMDSLPAISVLREILQGDNQSQKGKTIFVAVHDDQLDTAVKAVKSITGELDKPNAGVLFALPITYSEGLN